MGFLVCGMFVEVEGGKFEYSLGQVIPLLQEYMDPTKYSVSNENMHQHCYNDIKNNTE